MLYTKTLPLAEYIAGYRDAGRFMPFCESCPNFGTHFGCPPYDYDPMTVMKDYRYITIVAEKVAADTNSTDAEETDEILDPARQRLLHLMLRAEKECGGRGFGLGGTCLNCPKDTPCARLSNEPCRHPELVRPSLEAYGFDITLTLERLMNLKLAWKRDGEQPPYMTLVTALMHNSPEPPRFV